MNLPIRVRLTIWYAALLAAIIALLGTFLVLQLESDLREAVDDEARMTSASIIDAFAEEDHEGADSEQEEAVENAEDFLDAAEAGLPPSGAAQVLDDRGRVVHVYGAVADTEPIVDWRIQERALASRPTTITENLGPGGQGYRVHITAFPDGGNTRLMVVALSLEDADDAVGEVLLLLLVAGPAALVATALAGYWLARKALRPVERLTSDAQEIGAGQLHERVAVPAVRDEIGKLAVTLNAMLERIERGMQDRHRLVADASHELRTPLAVMRAEIDVSLRDAGMPAEAREVLESAREEVDRMRRTVDNLLALAEADEGRLELLTRRVNVRQALEEAAAPLRLLAAAKNVAVTIEGESWEAQVDPQRLHLAFTNLIENAIKFSPTGCVVRATSWRRAQDVGVTISDEGPGIPTEEQNHLFDRYYRADSARARNFGGSGLGLAICLEVALAHGGALWVDSSVGSGSQFSLALPQWRVALADEDSAQVGAPV